MCLLGIEANKAPELPQSPGHLPGPWWEKISIETRQNLLPGIAKRGLKQSWFLRFSVNVLFQSVICELNVLHFEELEFGLQQSTEHIPENSLLFQGWDWCPPHLQEGEGKSGSLSSGIMTRYLLKLC